ncbi:MAG: LysM peptidoglycan-binding domain-containing protein [Acidobacteriota bacterium]
MPKVEGPPPPPPPPPPPSGTPTEGGGTYTVRRGDTMTGIARQHQVPLNDLIQANPQIQNPDRIFPGQELSIPARQQPAVQAPPVDRFEPSQPNVFGQLVQPQLTPVQVDQNTRASTVADLDQAMTRTGQGMNATERQALERHLNGLSGPALQNETQFLRDHVVNSPNADRAARTYLELRDMQSANPSRINNDVVHTLTRGVADRRTDAAAGQEGLMGRQQAIDAATALTRMPQSEYNRVTQMLNGAGQRGGSPIPGADAQTERALILESVAARRDQLSNPPVWDRIRNAVGQPSRAMSDIQTYADQIRGTPRNELIQNSTVLDLNGDAAAEALQQRFSHSCAPTTAQIARAEVDPIYARQLHQEAIHSTAMDTAIGREQRASLEEHGGVAVARDAAGGRGVNTALPLNDLAAPYTNRTYTRNELADTPDARQQALDRADALLRRGVDVPVAVAWDGGGGHAQILTDVRGSGNNREYLLTDPYNGETRWLRHQDIVNGHTNFACGTGRLRATFE